jgi:signal transduction histidine kinase/HAMP domain-containing protein
MKTPQTPKDNNDEIAKVNIQKRLDNLYSKQELPSHASLHEVDAMKARISELEAKLAARPEVADDTPISTVEKDSHTLISAKKVTVTKRSTEETPQPFVDNPHQARDGSSGLRVAFIAKVLANISMGWKMAFMVSVLVLGLAGIVTISVRSLQRLQFHNSNLYEFMLIPIIELDDADTQLADVKYQIQVLEAAALTPKERTTAIEKIQTDQRAFKAVFERYQTEWLTTVSPEFTDLLREKGRLDLQQDEVATVDTITDALSQYDTSMNAYIKAAENRESSQGQVQATQSALQELRNHFDHLVAVNEEFAKLSFDTASTDYNQALVNGSIIVSLALAIGLFLSYLIVVSITGRLSELTHSASAMQQGDLNQAVTFTGRDEISLLGAAFNSMAGQLRDLFGSLEQRVADRTHDMELASEVGRAISEKIGNLTEMLTEAAETIRSRFDLYYTQVYLVDPSGRNLLLRAGTGDAGSQLVRRGHRLAISSASLNGRAALDRHAVIMGDTQQSSNFQHNPLLPLTRSELAIPLIVNNKVVGVLDMQNEKPETFSEANLSAFQVLAGQLAIAIQNAALFKEAEESRLVVEEQAARLTGSGWQQFMNAVDRNENIGYAFSQDEILPWVEAESPVLDNTLTVPIEITGATVGEVQLADGTNRKWTTAETEVVQAAVSHVGQHIENLRLFGQAEKYRSEAEQVSRRLTSEGWNEYLQTRKELADGYSYNLDKVQPLNGNGHNESVPALSYPLMVRDESIGIVLVDSKDGAESHTSEVISAVVEQLSGHIENLRLLEQAEQRRLELETVAKVSSTVSTVLDPDKLLQTVVDMTKERFGLYHAHIYLADQNWNTLLLASGAGEVGHKMVAEEHSISMDAEKSLVARALRERQPIIANDVRSQPDFLPNPLLPETRAEMAVPMIVSDKIIGVFDVQSDNVNGFSKEDAAIYTTLASQVAIALQNARLYVEQAATVTQLRELDRLKSSFLANMSHELRTPLNSILGFTDVMLEGLDGQLTDYMDNDLRLIQKNGQHLLHLINDVLDMAKIESGKMNLNPEKFKIHSVLDEVTSITSTLASEKNLSLFIQDDSDQEVEIFADNTRLRQVMINLVNNSIKFTEHGKITLKAAPLDGSRILISVKDTGIGIPPEQLEAVFQEFSQVDTSTTRKAGGTGLGLPISRRLVEMHGGRLWAESTGISGEGSTFFVELPVEARITDVIEKQEK